jgi:hypothetical protein
MRRQPPKKAIELHVVPAIDGWSIHAAGPAFGLVFRPKPLAVKVARALATKYQLELVVHSKAGRIRDRDSHGHDSPRRKG